MTATARLYRRGKWQQSEDGSETVVDVWEVRTDSETETITAVVTATGIPAKGASHPERTSAIVVERSADHDDGVLTLWYVEVRYSTAITTREDAAYNSQRVKGGMRSSSIEVPAFYDTRGYPLVNSAGDLYEGLTRKIRTRTVNVTYNAATFPDWVFELSDTINAAAVTIHGRTYEAGTCALRDVELPDEPERDKNGALYWPVSYTIEINPLGYYVLLPNKGPNELVYQTRTNSTAPWVDGTKATYDSTTASNRRIIKRPIQTEEQQQTGGEIWLNAVGQATKVPTLSATQLGTGYISAGSKTLTLSTGAFDSATHVGALVRVFGAGPKARPLEARIKSVTSSSVAELEGAAYTTVSVVAPKAIWLSGVIVNQFILEDSADWSSLPLPNNQP
jgi:hypothetical protein